MNQNSNITEIISAVVDTLTENGSGFATTETGEAIFINARIMQKMNLKEFDEIDAYVVPNYPDKQDRIKYRATRVNKEQTNLGTPPDLEEKIRRLLKEDTGLWSLREICEELAEEEQVVYDTLIKMEQVVRTDAYYIL
tara:strand:- start:8926 stop:9339 length:414 start_codon:yes stop_codon:yes gene_type:complete